MSYCIPFLMSSIDFNVPTKRQFWGVFEGIYYEKLLRL